MQELLAKAMYESVYPDKPFEECSEVLKTGYLKLAEIVIKTTITAVLDRAIERLKASADFEWPQNEFARGMLAACSLDIQSLKEFKEELLEEVNK